MIDRNDLIRIADRDGVDAKVVERDYVLTQIVEALGRHEESGTLIFKGGTSIRLCHEREFRYSADLDFSLTDMGMDAALALIEEVLSDAGPQVGFPELKLDRSDPPRIAYRGPLGSGSRHLKLDIADDELVESTESAMVIGRYSDQTAGSKCVVYTLEEIAAEKLRCLIQRVQCRDFLDLDYLLNARNLDLEHVWRGFEAKARHKQLDPSSFWTRLEPRIATYRKRWDDELEDYVIGEPPDFGEVQRSVVRCLRPMRPK